MGHEQVKLAADLARVAGDFAGAFFVRIQLFSTTMGRKMSCSSKRNKAMGSCRSTLVSSTKSLMVSGAAARRVFAVFAAFVGFYYEIGRASCRERV